MHPDLIIFDCDGVLIDSEPIAIRVLVNVLKGQGIFVSEAEAYRNFLGRSLSSISAALQASHGEPLGEMTLLRLRTELYAAYRRELRCSPGIPEILTRLDQRFCVASSSHTERIRVSLEVTGLLPWFDGHAFSASDVPQGKPAPDLFLHAAESMATHPSRCLVIEDSPAGIEAARSAGMAVLAYIGGSHVGPAGLLPRLQALAPDGIFDDMHALPDLVRSL